VFIAVGKVDGIVEDTFFKGILPVKSVKDTF